MNARSTTIDRWRKFFRSAEGDIFDVLEFAIVVAASDCPNDFKTRREDIAQKLFSCGLIRSADRESVSVDGDDDGLMEFRPTGWKAVASRSSDDAIERNTSSNCSYDEAEALTMAIEESSQILDEVLRIRLILEDSDESDSALLESLRKLQLMELSMDMLQASEIGRAVSRLKKHTNNQIRSLGKLLISGWKNMVDEWVQTTNTLCGDSPDSADPPTMVEEEGLPSPPLDEAAFLTTETTFEFSKFFEGMDDDGEPRNDGGHDKRREHKISSNESKDEPEKRAHIHGTRADACRERLVGTEQLIVRQTKAAARQTPKEKSGRGRPQELFGREESSVGNRQTKGRHLHIPANIKDPITPLVKSMDEKLVTKPKMQAKLGCTQKTSATLQDKSKSSDDMLVKVKLEAAKRKLHEGYRQAENAKKQRTIQVMELHDLPKQGLLRRNPNPKPGIHNRRQWNNKRR